MLGCATSPPCRDPTAPQVTVDKGQIVPVQLRPPTVMERYFPAMIKEPPDAYLPSAAVPYSAHPHAPHGAKPFLLKAATPHPHLSPPKGVAFTAASSTDLPLVCDPRRRAAARWDTRFAALLQRLTPINDGAASLLWPAAVNDEETREA